MSKLISTYAKSTGLKVSEPYLREHFFPIPFERYITIQTGSGQNSKNYDYYQEVVSLLKPVLDQLNVGIVHIGAKEDPALNGVYDLRGQTTLPHSAYIIKRSSLHIGNDSWIQHFSCFHKVPTIVLFGSTSADNHGSYWANDKTVFLESHRGGKKASFSQEHPKTINFVKSEDVFNNAMKLLEIDASVSHETIHAGEHYNNVILELIPNFLLDPNLLPDSQVVVRMDYHFNEEILLKTLNSGRKVSIFTNRDLSNNCLHFLSSFSKSINSYNHEVSLDTDLEYVKNIKKITQNANFYTKSKDEKFVADIRFKFFDIANILHISESSKKTFFEKASLYLNKKVDSLEEFSNIQFRSNKFILSEGKLYPSFAHFKSGISIESFDKNLIGIIDSDEFWKDLNNFYIIQNK